MIWKCTQCDCADEPCIIIDTLGTGTVKSCPMALVLTEPIFEEISVNELKEIIEETL